MHYLSTMEDLSATLAARRSTHGDFCDQARITRILQSVVRAEGAALSDTQAVALDMIMHKAGRILAGDPNVADHWHDIAGYATLCARELHDRV
jgi:hypothetical protein